MRYFIKRPGDWWVEVQDVQYTECLMGMAINQRCFEGWSICKVSAHVVTEQVPV